MANVGHQTRASAELEVLQGRVDEARQQIEDIDTFDGADETAMIPEAGDWREELALQQRARKQALILIIFSAAGSLALAYAVWVGLARIF